MLNSDGSSTSSSSSSSSSTSSTGSSSDEERTPRLPLRIRLRQGLKKRTAHRHTKDPTRKHYKFQLYKIQQITYDKSMEIPYPRSGHRIISTDADIFLLGGYNPDEWDEEMNGIFLELWKYNIATKKWELLVDKNDENMPQELASNAMLFYKNTIIAHGGTGYPFGEVCSNKTHIFGTKSSFVNQLVCTGTLPPPQYGPAIVVHNDYLYTIGGTTTGFDFFCDIYRLNLKTREWSFIYNSRPDMRDDPQGRYRHELVYTGKYILILGGGTSHSAFDLKRLPAFNLELNCWEYIDTHPDSTLPAKLGYPKSRKCYSCIQYEVGHTSENTSTEVVIAGGLGSNTECLLDIWKYHVKTSTWQLIRDKMSKPTYFHSAATSGNGCMYLFGGIEHNKQKLTRSNDLYKIWTTIPKLSEMCWDAITYYEPHLDKYSKESLLKFGLPMEYANRVGKYSKNSTSRIQLLGAINGNSNTSV